MRTRVAVAMSGGVDSSVACLLLAQKGFDVIGLTMKLLPNDFIDESLVQAPCCTLEMAEDARRICAELGVPHYTINLVDEFDESVITPFALEYASGRTPNPCLACNRYMKYGHLLQKARELDATYIATGHYARTGQYVGGSWVDNMELASLPFAGEDVRGMPATAAGLKAGVSGRETAGGLSASSEVKGLDQTSLDKKSDRTLLLRGVDASKDQSYALYPLSQDELSHALFPLGALTKAEVRRIASESSLVTADKPESQEICFVTHGYREFLAERGLKVEPGPMVDTSGKMLGTHQGVAFYTVGQRRGLGVARGRPLYVADIDMENNRVVVGTRDEALSSGCLVEDLNVIADESLAEPVTGTCMVRYRGRESAATMRPAYGFEERAGQGASSKVTGQATVTGVNDYSAVTGDFVARRQNANGTGKYAEIEFETPQFAVTPGQAAVFYQGERVYGGGVISRRISGRS